MTGLEQFLLRAESLLARVEAILPAATAGRRLEQLCLSLAPPAGRRQPSAGGGPCVEHRAR